MRPSGDDAYRLLVQPAVGDIAGRARAPLLVLPLGPIAPSHGEPEVRAFDDL